MIRVHFNARFTKGEYSTYTNGVLWSRHDRQFQSIIEVIRFPGPENVQMQETAEMVGWILHESPKLPDLNHQYVISRLAWNFITSAS
jgi:hypothetical protein